MVAYRAAEKAKTAAKNARHRAKLNAALTPVSGTTILARRTLNRDLQTVRAALPIDPQRSAACVSRLFSKQVRGRSIDGRTDALTDANLSEGRVLQQLRGTFQSTVGVRGGNQSKVHQALQTAVSVAVAVGVAPSRATVGNRSVALLGITRRGAARLAGAWADMPDAKDMTTDLHKAMFPDRFRLGTTTLPQATKVKVREYWTSATTPSPLTKDQIRDRLAPNVYEVHATHWVFDTFTTVYNEYMALHSVGHPLCQRLFEELRPYFVKPFCARQRQTCMCIYHLNQSYLTGTLDRLRTTAAPHLRSYGKASGAWADACLCAHVDGEWHDLRCIRGECDNCGADTMVFDDAEMEAVISWERYEQKVVQVQQRDGSHTGVQKLTLVEHSTTGAVLIAQWVKASKYYLLHRFENKWQTTVIKKVLISQSRPELVVWLDFAENFTVKMPQEPQSLHWMKHGISLLVCVVYAFVQDDDLNGWHREKTVHIFISDDPTHDARFVAYCRARLILSHLQRRDSHPISQYTQISDGCPSQFKCAGAFLDLTEVMLQVRLLYGALDAHEQETVKRHDVVEEIEHNVHATAHGRGEVDAAGGGLKSLGSRHNLRHSGADLITDAATLHRWASEKWVVPEWRKASAAMQSTNCHGNTLMGRCVWLVTPA